MRHYILDGNHDLTPVGLMEWAKWYETADRRVGLTDVGKLQVSTVFLGSDHNFGFGDEKRPILFETLVFEANSDPELGLSLVSSDDFEMWRYCTWAEAEAGHQKMCEVVQAAMEDSEALNTLLEEIEGL